MVVVAYQPFSARVVPAANKHAQRDPAVSIVSEPARRRGEGDEGQERGKGEGGRERKSGAWHQGTRKFSFVP
jgi:hypothetical protein